MKRTLKPFLRLLSVVLLLPALSACAGRTEPSAESGKETVVSTEEQTAAQTDALTDGQTEAQTEAQTEPETEAPIDRASLSDDDYFSDAYFIPVLRFSSASDVHIGDSGSAKEEARLKKMFAFTYELAENSATPYKEYDLAAFSGDISDNGTITSMKKAKSIMDKAVKGDTELLCMLGNHEFYTAPEGTVSRFREAFGVEERGHIVVNGFHFIYLSPDASTGWDFSSSSARWLNGELEKAAQDDPTRPIFVFEHEHVKGTVYGSEDWGVSALYSTLKKYPQVVSFTGHSHFPMIDPRSIWQGEFTAFGTGTLSYTEMGIAGVANSSVFPTDNKGHYAASKANGSDAAWFYVVEVDESGAVRVVGYDLDTETELVRYGIRTPSDPSTYRYNTKKRIAASEAPVFPDGAKIDVTEIGKHGFTVSFPIASSEDNVQHYRIEVLRDGKIVKEQYLLSCTFYADAPKTFTEPLSGLPKNSTCTVRVIAVNSFCKESEPLTAEVTLLPTEDTPVVGDVPTADVLKTVFGAGNSAVNEATGETLDVIGSAATEKDGDAYVGVFNGKGGFRFDGISGYYDELSSSVSFELYARVDQFTSPDRDWYNVASNQQAGGFGFEGDSNGRFFASAYIGGAYRTPGAKINKGEYFHAVVTYDGKTLCFYLNGELADSLNVSGGLAWPSDSAAWAYVIGGDSFNGGSGYEACFTGRIAEANIYSSVLTEAQVAALYASHAG